MIKVNVPSLQAGVDQPLLDDLESKSVNHQEWNSLRDDVGVVVKQRLEESFHCKCGYCEDNQGITVDHFWPQSDREERHYHRDIHPRWDYENFILCCSGCQYAKGVKKPQDAHGNWMINPRDPNDDPFCHLFFDYQTGAVTQRGRENSIQWQRGKLTIEILKLDLRGEKYRINEARHRKFLDVFGYMNETVGSFHDDPQKSLDAWQNLVDHLNPNSPYLAIVRQLILDPRSPFGNLVNDLRQIHPEFDAVIQEWCLPIMDCQED